MERGITPASWHARSWERLVGEKLPMLLAERLPLSNYEVEHTDTYNSVIRVTLAGPPNEVGVTYEAIPRPDQHGVFMIDGAEKVVVPLAEHDDLATARIRCVGEQVYDDIAARLGEASVALPWDESLVRTWLPLDNWIKAFLRGSAPLYYGGPTSQRLDRTNWLATQQHVRRVMIEGWLPEDGRPIWNPGHKGRVCPFEMPEGPNIGRIFVLARGAKIENLRLVPAQDQEEVDQLGLSASMIPLLEHNDPSRLLMGSNMMRQWLRPPHPESAMVQTGLEPDAPDFWCGRNLLTAFMAWGTDTVEDGIVLSASCAQRLGYPYPLEPGDKLSNRHGVKGVVSSILPDDQMPHMRDGTPIEIIYNFISFHARGMFGAVREAVLGRIAHADGTSFIAPPFRRPDAATIRERLAVAGLPPSGMERLRRGRDGEFLDRPSTIGWVYWGRLFHTAQDKISATTSPEHAQRQGQLEHNAIRAAGASQFLEEQFNLRSARQPDAATLARRVASGQLSSATSSPYFSDVQARLAVAGIRVEHNDGVLRFRLEERQDLQLAHPVPHPWLQERELSAIGVELTLADYNGLHDANQRVERVVHGSAPPFLLRPAVRHLHATVATFFDALLKPEHMRFDTRVLFSGRAVLAPGPGLRLNQVGIPDDIVWTLYGPNVEREVAAESIAARDTLACAALDATLERSWVVVNRSPSLSPTTFIAFRPVRQAERVIRIHPLVCRFLQADFDGDQAAVFLPLRQATLNEVESVLSVAAHLRRDPALVTQLVPFGDALLGLAILAQTEQGRHELGRIGVRLETGAALTRERLEQDVRALLAQEGAEAACELVHQWFEQGLRAAQTSGSSISPMLQPGVEAPIAGDDERRDILIAQVLESLRTRTDWDDEEIGPQLLALRTGAASTYRQLGKLLGVWDQPVATFENQLVRVEHGYRDGLTAAELFAVAFEAREVLAQIAHGLDWEEELPTRTERQSLNVLARAARSRYPGVVFARAAAINEVDPLTDPDSRSFVGSS